MLLPLLTLTLPLTLLPSITAYRLAQPVAQPAIQNRAQYEGGWALGLPGSTCPSSAPVACDTNDGTVNPTCCPTGQTCAGLVNPHCCPTNNDCFSIVENLPVCANSSWSLYVVDDKSNYFCCEEGQFGVLPTTGYAGLCQPNDAVVASTLIATLVYQIGGTAGATGGAATASSASRTHAGAGSGSGSGSAATTTGNPSSATGTGSNSSGSSSMVNGSSGVHFPKGAIIGIAIAGLVALIFAALFLWRCCAGRRRDAEGSMEPYRGQEYPQPMYQETPVQYGGPPVQEYKQPGLGEEQTAYGHQAPEWNRRAEMGHGRE